MNSKTDGNDSAEHPVPEDTIENGKAVEKPDAAFEPGHDLPPPDPQGSGGDTGDRSGAEADGLTRAPPPRRSSSTVVAWLALFLALAALAGSGYLAWQNRTSAAVEAGADFDADAAIAELSDEVDQAIESLAERQRSGIAELEDADRQVARQLQSLQRELEEASGQNESLAPRLSNLEDAISSLQGVSAGVRDTWLLAEAEYFMQIANAQLQLAGNPRVAILALRFAEERVRQMANPALNEVRRALTEELQALESMETPDLEGMALSLASLAERVDALPLAVNADVPGREPAAVDPELSGFKRAAASIKSAFGDIVSVRKTDEQVTPLLSPDAAYFLRANLSLKFESARLALLRGEQGVFEQALDEAEEWLREYYDARSNAVTNALDTIAELKDRNVTEARPDISDSLRLLRQYRTLRNAEASPNNADGSNAAEPDS